MSTRSRNGAILDDRSYDARAGCNCECHAADRPTTARCCSVDIELASLGRFENVFCAATRVLHEETDMFESRKATFRLHLAPRDNAGCDGGYLLSHMTTEFEPATSTTTDSDDSDVSSVVSCDSDASSGYGDSADDDDDETRSADALRRYVVDVDASPEWLSRSLVKLFASDGSSDAGESKNDGSNDWFAERAFKLASAVRYYLRLGKPAETQRLDVLRRLIVLPEMDVSAKTKLHVWLFFQWFRLMATLPVSYDHEMMNFAWASSRNTVRVFSCEKAFRRSISNPQGVTVEAPPLLDLAYEPPIVTCESVLTDASTVEPFAVSYGDLVLRNARDRCVRVLATSKDSEKAIAASTKRFSDRGGDAHSTTRKRQRYDGGERSSRVVGGATDVPFARITTEQRRVLAVLQNVLGRNLLTTRRDDTRGASLRRRVVIDGVAGAGKTFMLGILLNRFDRVRYLVKKRTFVETTEKRFGHDRRLLACTIDAFLMRHLNIRDLPTWLRTRAIRPEDLLRRLTELPVPRDDDELVFVDEYSLVEGSLAELLSVALVNRMVVLVGDCNQQSAIGDSTDRPVRTLLGYENVCFMYDNVRTKDARLLRRLAHFNVRTDDTCFLAVRGLPLRRTVDMTEYLNAVRDATTTDGATRLNSNDIRRLLPRVIVTSNESVNYLNWAMGTLIALHLKTPNLCVRYRRRIVFPAPTEIARFANGGHAVLDDAYADEHYVIVGMRYRMVHVASSWPVQLGSRVIVTAILGPETVTLVTDDDSATPFVVQRMSIRPYEYRSKWNDVSGVRIHMFPFVMDAATTVYQVQGLTLDANTYTNCYIDARGMDEKSLNVSLSRFQFESQIRGIANPQTLLD